MCNALNMTYKKAYFLVNLKFSLIIICSSIFKHHYFVNTQLQAVVIKILTFGFECKTFQDELLTIITMLYRVCTK